MEKNYTNPSAFVSKNKKKRKRVPKTNDAKYWQLRRDMARANYNINSRLVNYAIYGGQTSMAQTPVFSRITNIASGTGPASRADRSINLTHALIKFTCYSADTFNVCRVILIQARGSYPGATPTSGDVFQTVSGGAGLLDVVKPINQETFRILYDQTMTFTTAAWSCESHQARVVPKQKTIRFADSTGTTATSGDIFIGIMSDSGAVTHPGLDWFVKLHYTE